MNEHDARELDIADSAQRTADVAPIDHRDPRHAAALLRPPTGAIGEAEAIAPRRAARRPDTFGGAYGRPRGRGR